MKGRRVFCIVSAILCFHLLFSGCALLLVGAGVAGGIAVSKDTIEGTAEKSFDRVWNAAREVIKHEGFIRQDNKAAGELVGEVRKSQVKFEAQQISDRTVRFRVSARKTHKLLPDMNLANELYNKIFTRLK